MFIKKLTILMGAFLFLLIAQEGNAAQFTVKVSSKDLGTVMQQKDPQKYSKIKRINEDLRQLNQQLQSVPSGTPLQEAGRSYGGFLKSEKNKAATREWQGIVGTSVTVIGHSNDDPYSVMRLLVSQMVDGYHGHLKTKHAYACFTGATWSFSASIPKQCQESDPGATSSSQPGSPVGGARVKQPSLYQPSSCDDFDYAANHYSECQ